MCSRVPSHSRSGVNIRERIALDSSNESENETIHQRSSSERSNTP